MSPLAHRRTQSFVQPQADPIELPVILFSIWCLVRFSPDFYLFIFLLFLFSFSFSITICPSIGDNLIYFLRFACEMIVFDMAMENEWKNEKFQHHPENSNTFVRKTKSVEENFNEIIWSVYFSAFVLSQMIPSSLIMTIRI